MGIPAFWASPFLNPSDMGIPLSYYHSGLRVRVRVIGDAHITRVLGTGMPYAYHCDSTRKYMPFLSPVSSRFVVVLVLFQFREPDYLGWARNRLVSMTSNPGITLSRADSFIASLFPKILFSIMRLFITALIACLEQLLNLTQREKVSCYQKTSQYSERRAGDLATNSWGCRCICCTAKICRSTLRVSAAGIWIYKRKCKNLI